MRVRVGDAASVPGLLLFLAMRVDLVTAAASDTEADVTVLGSFAEGARTELEAHVDRWRSENPATWVVVHPSAARALSPVA